MFTTHTPVPVPRRVALRDSLLDTVDKLHRHRACEIPDGFIDDYVSLHWLEWHGGGLRVTTTGENVCAQLLRERVGAAQRMNSDSGQF